MHPLYGKRVCEPLAPIRITALWIPSMIGTHEANPTQAECTDCQSFLRKVISARLLPKTPFPTRKGVFLFSLCFPDNRGNIRINEEKNVTIEGKGEIF